MIVIIPSITTNKSNTIWLENKLTGFALYSNIDSYYSTVVFHSDARADYCCSKK